MKADCAVSNASPVSQLFWGNYKQLLHLMGGLYCRLFHKAISRPVRGKYSCWKCLREFELTW